MGCVRGGGSFPPKGRGKKEKRGERERENERERGEKRGRGGSVYVFGATILYLITLRLAELLSQIKSVTPQCHKKYKI